MEEFSKIRPRRNTNLSASSTSSIGSAAYESLNEKDALCPALHTQGLPMSSRKDSHSRLHARSWLILIMRVLITLCAIFALWCIVFVQPFKPVSVRILDDEATYPLENAADDRFHSDEPSTLTLSDNKGHSRWSVRIAHNYSFPLQGKHAQKICRQSELLRNSLSQRSRFERTKDWRRRSSYYAMDNAFLEVREAEDMGIMPHDSQYYSSKVCKKSLTFALDAADDGFGKSLLLLWLSYGLARKEGRAFFIDDTRWPYGHYTSFFSPPPAPDCVPPPMHHVVPCPHSANHLLVSSATLRWTFGSSFEEEFMQPRTVGIERSRHIYDLLRHGYEDLFHLVGEHALYSASRIAKFREEAYQHNGSVIGIHLRRGDLHPFEYQFSQDYLPVERYGSAACKLLRSQLETTQPDTQMGANDVEAMVEGLHSPLLLASDDPEIFESTELMQSAAPFIIQKAQERVQLATKSQLDLSSPAESYSEPGSVYTKHVENAGWEGGFYKALFFSLGESNVHSSGSTMESQRGSNHSTDGADGEVSSEQARRMQELVGKGYLLDLAILGQSDGVVCAISSSTCRLLGVMLGWNALSDGRWVNIDDNRVFSWDGRR